MKVYCIHLPHCCRVLGGVSQTKQWVYWGNSFPHFENRSYPPIPFTLSPHSDT